MFGIDSAEFLLVAVIALVVIGPKELPRLLRTVGYWVGKARGTVRQFRAGIDDMIRESELQEMEKKWRAENERILQEHPDFSLNQPAAQDDEPLYPENAAPMIESTQPIDAAAEDGGAPELPFDQPAGTDAPKSDPA